MNRRAKRNSRRSKRTIFDEWKTYPYVKSGDFMTDFLAFESRFLVDLNPKDETFVDEKIEKKNSSRRNPNKNAEKRYVAYRFRGKPDDEQARLLSSFCGSTRFIWNRWVDDYRAGRPFLSPSRIKREAGHEWMRDVDSYAFCNVQLQFERAKSEYESGDKGKPKFHKKHERSDSYTTNRKDGTDNVSLNGRLLKLPKIKKPIRLVMHRNVEAGGKLKNVTVVHEPDGKWFFSLVFEYDAKPEKGFSSNLEEFFETGNVDVLEHVGFDMSLARMFVASDGSKPEYELESGVVRFERQFRKYERKIAREQRKLSHMQKDSNNYAKQLIKISRLHARAKHARNDFVNQLAVRIARKYDVVSIEDLDMSAMKKALRFGKSVSDVSWGRFVEIFERKMRENDHVLVRIDRWFPSSKTCRKCGHVHKELKLSDRIFVCPKCGSVVDRDEQASMTIDDEGLRILREIRNGDVDSNPKKQKTA